MINLIAPGLLHHEIGFNMRTAYGQAYEQFHLLKRIAQETGREDVELAARYAHGIAGLVLTLYSITDAFNNLDKRGQVEDSDLNRVFTDIKLLLHHRLGHAHTEFTWDEAGFKAQNLRTDVVLLSQAIINLINNALNALREADTPPPRGIQVILEQADPHRVRLSLANNGPPILAHEARDIFRRGYTTRTQGHGQGLYLARLVAHYLGGDLTLMEKSALPSGFQAGFRLSFNRNLPAEHGVARAAD
jgi:signal transduction histidine kinase